MWKHRPVSLEARWPCPLYPQPTKSPMAGGLNPLPSLPSSWQALLATSS